MKNLLIISLFFQTLCAQEKGDDQIRMVLGRGFGLSDWKLMCWASHVVVLEGELTFKDEKAEADVEMTVKVPLTEREKQQSDQTHKKEVTKYRVAQFTPTRFHFAAPGMTTLIPNIGDLAHGEMKPQEVLVSVHGEMGKPAFAAQKKAVYVMSYNAMVRQYPLVVETIITVGDLASAEKMFKLRNKFDHRSAPLEQGQTEKPPAIPETNAEGNKKPQAEPEGRSR